MSKELFAVLLAGTLLIPLITPAGGEDDVTIGFGGRPQSAAASAAEQTLPLSPVPHLEGVPWWNSGAPLKGTRIDTLFGPKLDTLGPFLLQPVIPDAQLSVRTGPPAQDSRLE